MRIVLVVLMAIVLVGCGGLPHQDQKAVADLQPSINAVVEAAEQVHQDVKTVTQSIQDLRQIQGAASTKLAGDIESVGELVQTVNATVENYGLSPELRALLCDVATTGVLVLAGMVTSGVGLLVLLLFMKPPALLNGRRFWFIIGGGALIAVGTAGVVATLAVATLF